MANKTAYVRRPEEPARGGDSFGSIWIVGAVALIALFTLFGLYMAHYSLAKRIDAKAEQARKERAALQQKIAALQQQLRGGAAVARAPAPAQPAVRAEAAAAEPAEPAEPPPAPAAAAADTEEADDGDDQPTRVRVASVPAGARVMEGFRELGITPLEVAVKSGERRQVSLQRAGYRARRVTLSPARPRVTVRLARVPVHRARAKAKKKGGEDEDSPLFNPYD